MPRRITRFPPAPAPGMVTHPRLLLPPELLREIPTLDRASTRPLDRRQTRWPQPATCSAIPSPRWFPQPTGDPLRDLPVRISPEETQTGRLMFGVGVNSDAGLVGNITLDEQNFDWRHVPTSWEDIMEGRAFRGRGRAVPLGIGARHPGPALHGHLHGALSGQSAGELRPERLLLPADLHGMDGKPRGRQRQPGLPVHARPDGQLRFQGQNVNIKNPEFPVPDLLDVLGHNQLYTFSASPCSTTPATIPSWPPKDTCSRPRLEETVGTFQYPRASVEWSQFFRIFERADRSGKHVLSLDAQGRLLRATTRRSSSASMRAVSPRSAALPSAA